MLQIQVVMDGRVIQLLSEAVNQLTRIGDAFMALKDELTALATAVDTATNAVAAEMEKTRQQVADLLANPNSITDADKTEVEAAFQKQIDRLTVLGQDPANPVPPAA
jgi:ABC-type transporter Mla subunit MlaD